MESIQISVKNTFVHLAGVAGGSANRRCASLPHSFRLEAGRDWKLEGCGPSSCAEISTQAELSEEASCHDDVEVDSHDCSLDSPMLPYSAQTLQPPLVLPVWPESVAQEPRKRPRLNSRAQAWTPGVNASPLAGVAVLKEFLAQFATAVCIAVSTLKPYFPECYVEAVENQTGWSIVVQFPSAADFQNRRNQAITVASQALIKAASTVQGVHVLGGMVMPFVSTPFGCTGMLGAVRDDNQACWDALARGFCHRGRSCRWEHPVCLRTVDVFVKLPGITGQE